MARPAGSCCPAEGTTAKSAATSGPAPKPAACSWTRAAPAATPSAASPAPSRSGATALGTTFCLCVHCSAVMVICLKSQAMFPWAQGQLSCKVQGGQVSPLSNPGAKFAETAELRGQVREALHSHQELRAAPVQAPLLRWQLPTLRTGADPNCKRSYDCYSITILRSSSLPSAPFASCCQAKHFHS